jgi:C-terminal processing protease CtpA/Prc
LSFGDYSKRGGFEDNRRALDRALDEILGDATHRALVIDVRMSFGGDDQLGLAIAARLTTKEYMAYAIQARSDLMEPTGYTQSQTVTVRPSRRPVFSGPVVELIGPITMSAAETFTQALMGRTPRVVRIGENTQGVFCDVLSRRLPNGWSFALPNAVYRNSEGRAFDVHGIPPDIAVPVFADDDIAARRDPAMAAAMKQLIHSSRQK